MNEEMNILVVDDFSTMRHIIGNMLREIGFHNIMEAEGGEDALPLLKSDNIDFVVVDWHMQGMDGLTFLRKIRADSKLSEVPILMVTAAADPEQISIAEGAGANGYVVKPFNVNLLRDRIENILIDVRGDILALV